MSRIFGYWKCICGCYTQYLASHCRCCGKSREESEDRDAAARTA